ncbi:MAG: DUF169 domain-containing protein [Deltaproteobacteria bacterium]|nr:DUF169 domain-containing protein [Deltaproteobacteria bacterium]
MDVKQIDEALTRFIRPATFPLAVKLASTGDELPERARRPLKDFGYPIALCQATALTRRYGWTMAVGKEDQCCLGGAQAMGFVAATADQPIGPDKRQEPGRYRYHVTATLDRAEFVPDVVVVYGNSAQIMRLVQAGMGGPAGGGSVHGAGSGFGDCGDIAAGTVLRDECQMILPSGGDRVFGGTQDHEMIFAMPWGRVEAVISGLEETHKAGFRYPVITDVRHRPNLPPFLRIPEEA